MGGETSYQIKILSNQSYKKIQVRRFNTICTAPLNNNGTGNEELQKTPAASTFPLGELHKGSKVYPWYLTGRLRQFMVKDVF